MSIGINPAERPSNSRFVLEVVASIAIFLGVAGELWAGAEIAYLNGQLRNKNSDLRSKSDQLLALVTQQAGDAETSAKIANNEAGSAVTKSDKANHLAGAAMSKSNAANDAASDAQKRVEAVGDQADDIDRALWQMQSLANSRFVTNMESLKNALRKFHGEDIEFTSYNGSQEADILCNSLVNAAHAAEMNPTDRCGKEPAEPTDRLRIIQTNILISGPDPQKTAELSGILADQISGGIAAVGLPTPRLIVLVGNHPDPQIKLRPYRPPMNKQTSRPNTKP